MRASSSGHRFDARGICSLCGVSRVAAWDFGFECRPTTSGWEGGIPPQENDDDTSAAEESTLGVEDLEPFTGSDRPPSVTILEKAFADSIYQFLIICLIFLASNVGLNVAFNLAMWQQVLYLLMCLVGIFIVADIMGILPLYRAQDLAVNRPVAEKELPEVWRRGLVNWKYSDDSWTPTPVSYLEQKKEWLANIERRLRELRAQQAQVLYYEAWERGDLKRKPRGSYPERCNIDAVEKGYEVLQKACKGLPDQALKLVHEIKSIYVGDVRFAISNITRTIDELRRQQDRLSSDNRRAQHEIADRIAHLEHDIKDLNLWETATQTGKQQPQMSPQDEAAERARRIEEDLARMKHLWRDAAKYKAKKERVVFKKHEEQDIADGLANGRYTKEQAESFRRDLREIFAEDDDSIRQ